MALPKGRGMRLVSQREVEVQGGDTGEMQSPAEGGWEDRRYW